MVSVVSVAVVLEQGGRASKSNTLRSWLGESSEWSAGASVVFLVESVMVSAVLSVGSR